MSLFADEIEFRRRGVAIQTRLLQRRIEHLVSAIENGCAVGGDLQGKKFPAVGIRKRRSIMLDHGFGWDQLQNSAFGVLLIGHAVLKNLDRLFELLGIGVLNPSVSHLGLVEQAAEGFFGDHQVIRRNACGERETQHDRGNEAHHFSVRSMVVRWPEAAERTPNGRVGNVDMNLDTAR